MNATLWHELWHAFQRERYSTNNAFFEAYHGSEFVNLELEARELAPFQLFTGAGTVHACPSTVHGAVVMLFSDDPCLVDHTAGRPTCLVDSELST